MIHPFVDFKYEASASAATVPLIAALAAPCSPVLAQNPESAGVAIDHLKVGEASFGGDARIGERQTGFRAWSPALPFDVLAFQAGVEYAYTRYSFDGLPTRARDLHHLHVPLRWRDQDDRWALVVTPLIATSSNVFKDFLDRGSRDDLDLHLRFEIQRWSDSDRGWRLALVRDNAFGSARIYPAAALLWKGRRLQGELGLPSSRVEWQAHARLKLGAAVFPTGNSWHVVSDERGGAQFDYRARAWRAAVTADWQPWRRLHASAQAGLEFRRHYELEDDRGSSISRDAGSAGYFRLEFRFNFQD